MWAMCDEAIEQPLELSFQTLFAGGIKIRHRGSEESVDAVRRQCSQEIADRITESAGVPDYVRSVKLPVKHSGYRG